MTACSVGRCLSDVKVTILLHRNLTHDNTQIKKSIRPMNLKLDVEVDIVMESETVPTLPVTL